jgi:hypothetical protein
MRNILLTMEGPSPESCAWQIVRGTRAWRQFASNRLLPLVGRHASLLALLIVYTIVMKG